MKKNVKIFVYFLLPFSSLITAYPQSNKYTSFRDYPLVRNIDSLEVAVSAKKNNPEQYLHGLITLELNRKGYTGWFGQDLVTIKTLAHKLRSPLAIAMYQYLEGNFLIEQHLGTATRNTLQAIQYFETTKDTSGMIESYYSILFSNILGNQYKINKTKSSTIYYDRIMSLGQKSSALRDKVRRIMAMTNLEDMVTGKKYETKRVLEIIDEAFLFLKQHPNTAPLDGDLYNALSRLYSIISITSPEFIQKAYEYDLKSLETERKRTSKIDMTVSLNTAIQYANLGAYKKAEMLLLKAINEMEQLKEENKDLRTYFFLYVILADVQFEQKKYATARASESKGREIAELRYTKLKTSFFEELNTQYILNEKEIENNQLKQSSQLTELRNQQFRAILFLSLIALSIVLTLLYFLFKSNEKQKRLMLFRDQLFAIIAHDLRSPMSTFQRYSDIIAYLVKTKQFDRLETTTQHIDQIGKNLSTLLNNLLAWSVNEQSNIKNAPDTINIKLFFEELIPVYQDIATLSSLTLLSEIEHTEVVMDSHKFALIMRNMLDNAIKFSEENNQVKINAVRHKNEFSVSISNKSRASTTNQKKALKEFFNSDKNYLIGENKDLGIGAILVKEYAKIMGAKITFDFDVDCLTIFTFSLPLTTK